MPDEVNMRTAREILEEIYAPALKAQIEDSSQFLLDLNRPALKLTRRIKFRYWRRRVISNIKDAWHVLWHGPDKFMDW